MFLDEFHSQVDGQVIVSAEQASKFAKEIAGDFNKIHDPDATRFCVPGDLLFALALSKFGLSQKMTVTFSGMVGRDVALNFPMDSGDVIELTDQAGKVYTKLERSGDISRDASLIEALARQYVAFSGQNFPFILVPLLRKHQVMFNTKRPLVIYESMAFEIDRLDIKDVSLELIETSLEVNGKRGDAHFKFAIKDGDEVIGKGDKKLIVGGLMPFDEEQMAAKVDEFNSLKNSYFAGKN